MAKFELLRHPLAAAHWKRGRSLGCPCLTCRFDIPGGLRSKYVRFLRSSRSLRGNRLLVVPAGCN
jgi:hypothetical protein